MKSRPVDLRPPRALSLSGWIWAGWAFSCTALLVGSAFILADQYFVSDTRTYSGRFSPTGRKVHLAVPADVPLARILVAEGEEVHAGQRLASFDAQALAESIDRISLQILLKNAEIECLLNKTTLPDENVNELGLSVEARLAFQAMFRECQLVHRQFGLQRSDLQRQIETMKTRADLAARTLVTNRSLREQMSVEEIALRVAVEKQRFAANIDALELLLVNLSAEQEGAILQQVAEIRQLVEELSGVLTNLERSAEEPWLIAPESGRIHRVRPVPEQTVFPRETEILTLKGDQTSLLEAYAHFPSKHAKRFESGDAVQVKLSGIPVTADPLTGHIAGIYDTPGQTGSGISTTVEVLVDLQDIQNPQLRELVERQMDTGQTGGNLTFEMDDISALETLIRSAHALLPENWSG